MSDQNKILDVKIYLESEFPDYKIVDIPYSRSGPPKFEIIHEYEFVAIIEFRRNVWDDHKTLSGLLSKINIASKIRDNIGKTIIVTEDECIISEKK